MEDDNNEILLIRQILKDRKPPVVPESFSSDEAREVFEDMLKVRSTLLNFANGNLDDEINFRGPVASCFKTLQANLRHLAWQVKQVADGDFSQRVDFLGDFSVSFNRMVVQLDHFVRISQEKENKLTKLTNDLRANEERWSLAVQCSRDGIWDVDTLNKTAWYSDNFMQMLHYVPDDIPRDLRWDLLVHPDDQNEADILHQVLHTQENILPFSIEFRLRDHDGDYLWIRLRGMPVNTEVYEDNEEGSHADLEAFKSGFRMQGDAPSCPLGRPKHRLVAVASDISAQKEIEHNLSHRALHDNLTGLPNRALLNDRLRQCVARADRTGEPFVLVTLDLDNFKGVNDTYGHAAGDTLLVELSKRLDMGLRNTDTAARVGGDEFVMVFPCATDMEEATVKQVMERFYANIAKPVNLGSIMYSIRSSAGLAFYPKHAVDLASLFVRADEALYHSKHLGKNQYSVWDTSMQNESE